MSLPSVLHSFMGHLGLHLKLNSRVFLSLMVFLKTFIYLWLCWVFVAERGLSLVMASGYYSLDSVHGLLIALVSVLEHRLYMRGL